jgi:hypothetical protein
MRICRIDPGKVFDLALLRLRSEGGVGDEPYRAWKFTEYLETKRCKNANLETVIWKSRRSASAAWG